MSTRNVTAKSENTRKKRVVKKKFKCPHVNCDVEYKYSSYLPRHIEKCHPSIKSASPRRTEFAIDIPSNVDMKRDFSLENDTAIIQILSNNEIQFDLSPFSSAANNYSALSNFLRQQNSCPFGNLAIPRIYSSFAHSYFPALWQDSTLLNFFTHIINQQICEIFFFASKSDQENLSLRKKITHTLLCTHSTPAGNFDLSGDPEFQSFVCTKFDEQALSVNVDDFVSNLRDGACDYIKSAAVSEPIEKLESDYLARYFQFIWEIMSLRLNDCFAFLKLQLQSRNFSAYNSEETVLNCLRSVTSFGPHTHNSYFLTFH